MATKLPTGVVPASEGWDPNKELSELGVLALKLKGGVESEAPVVDELAP